MTTKEPTENYTYGDLLTELQALTPEQQNQQVRWVNEQGNGKVRSLWTLEEDHIDPSGDGMEPISAYCDTMGANEEAEYLATEQVWPAGLVLLSHE